jgi:hypothetical protein
VVRRRWWLAAVGVGVLAAVPLVAVAQDSATLASGGEADSAEVEAIEPDRAGPPWAEAGAEPPYGPPPWAGPKGGRTG